MDNFLSFLADNYIWFLVGAGVLLLSLIGLIVNNKKQKKKVEDAFSETTPTTENFMESQPDGIVDNAGENTQAFRATPNEVAPETVEPAKVTPEVTEPVVESTPVVETPAVEPVIETPVQEVPQTEPIESVDLNLTETPTAPPEAKVEEINFGTPATESAAPIFEEPVIKPEEEAPTDNTTTSAQ